MKQNFKNIDEIGMERLSEASYRYEIWTNDENTDDLIVLAQNQEHMPEDLIFPKYSLAFSSFLRFFPRRSKNPIIAFIGVRMT